jgi:hypothetical protein
MNQESVIPDWDMRDAYEDICVKLFSALVLNRVGRNNHTKSRAYDRSPEPLSFFRVVPSPSGGVPIRVNREKNNSQYWDHPTTLVKPDEVDMRFIDFFDFGVLDFRDFQYCRVRIVGSNANADLVGRDALLECRDIVILFDDTAP